MRRKQNTLSRGREFFIIYFLISYDSDPFILQESLFAYTIAYSLFYGLISPHNLVDHLRMRTRKVEWGNKAMTKG